MNTNAYLPLYDYLNAIPATSEPDEVSAVSYSNVLDDISIALVDYRLKHHLTQAQLAKKLECSQSLVSAYESGARNISAEKLCDLMAKIGKKISLAIEDIDANLMHQADTDCFPDSGLKYESDSLAS